MPASARVYTADRRPSLTAFLSGGFRPFFLAAGLHAAVSLIFWLVWLGVHHAGGTFVTLSVSPPPYIWHAHEMLFGFAGAAVGGFLLTAVPNWTGHRPVAGLRLAALVWLWLAGRIALWASAALPGPVVAGLDLLFLPALVTTLAGPVIRSGKRQNMAVIAVIALLWVAQILSHLGMAGILTDGGRAGRLMALDVLTLLMTVIGGRITPAFSRNWLSAQGLPLPPAVPMVPWTPAALTGILIVLAGDLSAQPMLTAAGALLAAVALLVRLALWQGWRVRSEPLLLVLHLGALWLGVGYLLRGLAALSFLPEAASLHALTTGAAGTLVLGVMCRAALGHTGRALSSSPGLTSAFALVSLAALLRVVVPVALPGFYMEGMLVAGAAWVAAFVLYVIHFLPILTTPR
ncbi:NnrS family protein [Novispirillum itersonii]|uniref:NnrS family protein n=1 Tax=Novispirillum itersonii TaxID=189 RepID=UPI000378123C|nr:NnrS family protein [Novispirillum itersonii]